MFDNSLIVSTALSSFNNAALVSPYFFVVALFSIPLFFILFLYGRDLISKINWIKHDTESKLGFMCVASLMAWLLVFGGNYAVIRDSISLLPITIAFVLFVSTVFLINANKQYKYIDKVKNKKNRWFVFLLVLLLAGFSAMPTWWGILLQISAILCGMIVGDRLHKSINGVDLSIILLLIMTVLFLMQPEYFRFGQLGNLTIIHIVALLLSGFLGVTALVAKYTHTRGKIHQSAYIKLKWLFRILSLLALILFVLTESVPVFVALLILCAITEMLSVYHKKQLSGVVYLQSWALLMITFGIISICPFISMLGILWLLTKTEKININNFIELL